MILVDIYVPSLDKTYDFQVDSSAPIGKLIMEIAEMLGNETKSGKKIDANTFMLCSREQNCIFDKMSALRDYGIKNGSTLMLV